MAAPIIRLDVDAQRVLAKFDRLPKEIQTGVRNGLERGLILAEGRIQRSTRIKSRRGAAGLLGRLAHVVSVRPGIGIDARIGFRKTRGFPYELAQEFGAKAKPGKAMVIPVSAAAKRSGGPRKMEGLFRPPHTHVLAEAYKRGGGIKQIHWVLEKSIPPRLGFRKSVVASLPEISRGVVEGARKTTGAE